MMLPSRRSAFPLLRAGALAAVLVLVGATLLHAQPAAVPDLPPVSSATSPSGLPTVTELFNTSPIINSIILFLSVVATVMFIYFLLTINTRTFAPAGFIDDVTKLAVGRQYEQAAHLCRNNRAILAASILQRCFENAHRDAAHLMTIIESEGQRRASLVWNKISYLIDLSTIAPMLGLLGTVLGMLFAFFAMPRESAGVSSKVLAFSIGGAMTATFMGLVVAIMCVVYHAIVKGRALRALSETEQVVHSIADYIKRGQA